MEEGLNQPKPRPEKYAHLLADIERGFIKIPKFQRDFIWNIQQTAKLLDSIIKGYPIGTFILWKTRERLGNIKEIGGVDLPATPSGDSVQYVLDGQQRLASLYVALKGLKIQKGGRTIDYKKIYVNLDEDIDSDEPIITSERPENVVSITVHDLLSEKMSYFTKNYPDYIDKIQEYLQRFKTYDFSTIALEDYHIDAAIEVFTRINTTGTELTLFEIMSARTYDEEKKFDMQEKYSELQDELERVGYDTIPSSTVLQCLSVNLVQEATRKAILKLDKDDIINTWDESVESIKSAIDYLRTSYRIPASLLLPYNALLVPFSHFFFNNDNKAPNPTQKLFLQEYFWRSSLSYRFSEAVETKLGQDAKRVDQIIDGKRPKYDFNILLEEEKLKSWEFSTGDSYCKAILCLFAYYKPRSFDDDSDVILDNSWLKRSNSRNYHHFFPRKYLENNNIKNENSIVNITLVSERLNKREIGAKPPSKYMKKFEESNPRLSETLKTHLIDDLNEFGIWTDDYEKFLEERAKKIIRKLRKRIEI